MFCRVALHEKTPGIVASDEARNFRAWVKGLPGFVGGYHVQDSETGRMLFITVWESKESMEALRGETPPGGSLGIVTDREELFDVLEDYWDSPVCAPGCAQLAGSPRETGSSSERETRVGASMASRPAQEAMPS